MARSSRAALVLAVVVAAVVVTPAPPAGARHTWIPPVDRSPVPALARKTIVEGAETGWLRVRLPEPARLSHDPAVITGDGRLVALYLMHEEDWAVRKNGAYLAVERFGWCAERACSPDPFASTSGGARTSRDGTLPAGTYRLFLIADGAPASVTIELRGLSGATRLRPRFEAEHELRTLEPREPVEGVGPFYSAGAEKPFDGPGISFLGHYFDPDGPGAATFGYCVYRKDAPGDPATAYLPPGCPTTRLSNTWLRYQTPTTSHVMGFTLGMTEIPAALGAWHVASAPVSTSVTIGLWLRTS